MDSSVLRWALRRRIRNAGKSLKEAGINPHAGEKHYEFILGRSHTDERSGTVKISHFGVFDRSAEHELAHRAHILRNYAPTKRLRRGLAGKYVEEIPAAFGAITEMLATLAENKHWTWTLLERKTKRLYDHLAGDDITTEAMVLAVRNAVLDMWRTARKEGLSRKDARTAILQALYNSRDLHDLKLRREAMKDFADLRRTGIRTSLDEILAIWALRRWKK